MIVVYCHFSLKLLLMILDGYINYLSKQFIHVQCKYCEQRKGYLMWGLSKVVTHTSNWGVLYVACVTRWMSYLSVVCKIESKELLIYKRTRLVIGIVNIHIIICRLSYRHLISA